MQGASFCPILKPQDILDVMQQLEIPIQEEDLEKPTPQRVQIWYEAFLFILKGVSLEQLTESTPALDITEYPESHGDDILLMSFYQHMSILLRQVGVDDFSLRDMLKPEPARIRRILSGVCNFAMFRDDRMPVLEKYTSQADSELEKLDKMQHEFAAIQEKIDSIRTQRQSEVPKVQELQTENDALRKDLRELSGSKSELMSAVDTLRKEKESLVGAVAEIKQSIGSLNDELLKLRARVVHSPDKIQQAIKDLNDEIAGSRTTTAENEKKSQAILVKISALESIVSDIRQCVVQMERAEDVVAQHEAELKLLSREREGVSVEEENIRNLGVRETQLEFQNRSGREKIERLEKSRESKQSHVEERIACLVEERKKVLAKFEETSREMSSQRERFDGLQADVRNAKAGIEGEIASVQKRYEELRSQTLEYQDRVSQALEDLLAQFYNN